MTTLVDVGCPACGAPLRINPREPLAVCTHCRVQSRVERVASAADLAKPGAEGVIRVVVVDGLRAGVRALAVVAGLVAVLILALTANYVAEHAGPGLEADAAFVLELRDSSSRLDTYRVLTVLRDRTIVVGSESGQLVFVTAAGVPEGRLDLPLPQTRAQLRGLAPDASGGFYASFGGAIVHVRGRPFADRVGPALPADPALRVYDAIATDAAGGLYATTQDGRWVRVDEQGVASGHLALGVAAGSQNLALGPSGRFLLHRGMGDEAWWFDPSTASLSPVAGLTPSPTSSIAYLPSGALVYDTRETLVHFDGHRAQSLSLGRDHINAFLYLAADAHGDVVALAPEGTLVRYEAQRIAAAR